MRIDSHQHFWRYSAEEYPWIQAEWPIQRDCLPDDLVPGLKACGLDGCIAVQARQSLEETRWLLELADSSVTYRSRYLEVRNPRQPHRKLGRIVAMLAHQRRYLWATEVFL